MTTTDLTQHRVTMPSQGLPPGLPGPEASVPASGSVTSPPPAAAQATVAPSVRRRPAQEGAAVLRALLGHRDGLAAAGLALVLLVAIHQLAVLRYASTANTPTGGPQLGLLPFLALQGVLVAVCVGFAAHGRNPLQSRFDAAAVRLEEARAEVDAALLALDATRAGYLSAVELLAACDTAAVHHIGLLPHHGRAAVAAYEGGLRAGMAEPQDGPLYGRHELPLVAAIDDARAFLLAGVRGSSAELPSDLDHADVLARALRLTGAGQA